MTSRIVYVVPDNQKKGWLVKTDANQTPSIHTTSKMEAIKLGRVISQRSGLQLVIFDESGDVQRLDEYHKTYSKETLLELCR